MFEQPVEKTIGSYIFDPMQLSLAVLKGKGAAVRFQFFSGYGETIIDLPLSTTTVDGIEISLQNALNEQAPIKLKFKSKSTYVLHLSRFDKEKSEYAGGGLAMLLARFIPVFGMRCRAQLASANRFLVDLKQVTSNPTYA